MLLRVDFDSELGDVRVVAADHGETAGIYELGGQEAGGVAREGQQRQVPLRQDQGARGEIRMHVECVRCACVRVCVHVCACEVCVRVRCACVRCVCVGEVCACEVCVHVLVCEVCVCVGVRVKRRGVPVCSCVRCACVRCACVRCACVRCECTR